MATSNDSNTEEEDVGTLIYRESQLRKAAEAAAAAAADCKLQTSSASTHQRTSTRKRSPVANQGTESLSRPQRKNTSKRKRKDSLGGNQPRKKVAKKQYRYECSADGCSNIVVKGGLCVKHGAKRKRQRYECSIDGCTNHALKGGVCIRHGAKVKRCSSEGCTNYVVKGGVCIRHGAKIKRCSSEGCTNNAVKGGLCRRHGAKKKLCSSGGCTNQVKRGGLCRRHGAYRITQDESTAFGSEFDTINAAQTLPNQRALRATVRREEENSVPKEVIALCQEIVEV